MSSENFHGKKVAIIHIGTMKVGTTSIQKFFRVNRDRIRDRDGLYWLADYVRSPENLARHMAEAGAVGKSILLCDEGLWHYAFSDRADIQGLKDALPGYEFRVVMYVRRPDEFLESWFLQGVKSGNGAALFRDFLDHTFVRRGLNFKGRLPKIEEVFGPITVRAYERSQLKDGDAVSDFIDFVGIDEDGLERPPLENVTPDPNVLMMARIVRESAEHSELGTIRAIAESIGRASKSSILHPQEMREIDRRYHGQIEWLQENYGQAGRATFFDKWIPARKAPDRTLRAVYDRIMTKRQTP